MEFRLLLYLTNSLCKLTKNVNKKHFCLNASPEIEPSGGLLPFLGPSSRKNRCMEFYSPKSE